METVSPTFLTGGANQPISVNPSPSNVAISHDPPIYIAARPIPNNCC
ncbi:hypothetical protein ES705_19413 [subsurface metagenome]